jgi:hypothetical protein
MKILIFAPCEKVIIDRAGIPSLVSILQNVNVPVAKGQSVPANAVAPKEWFVFTHWLGAPEEMGQEFAQRTQIVLPDGRPFGDPKGALTSFKLERLEQRIVQNIVALVGFPIGIPGRLAVRVWVEAKGVAITEVHEYPLTVIHNLAAAPN